MAAKKGSLSINSENMLPIIKKWLYSDHDIFIREQVANACDAITKLKKLEGVGEYTQEEGHPYEIRVIVDPDEKTLKIIDNGIGMTETKSWSTLPRLHFQAQASSLRSTRARPIRIRS